MDARGPNQCHRRPPHSRLGSLAAAASLDLSDEALRSACLDPDNVELWMATLDLVDYFYQFHDLNVASWWGVDFPERADVWGVTRCWCEDAQAFVDVHPHELLYFVFEGMPMGWSWALYFAQAAMETPFEKALGSPPTAPGASYAMGSRLRSLGPAALWALSTSIMAPSLQLPVQTARQATVQ